MTIVLFSFVLSNIYESFLCKAGGGTGKNVDLLAASNQSEWQYAIGHLHDGVILLPRLESFSFFLSYLNFVIPVWFKEQKT